MITASQSKLFTNIERLKVPIVDSYPEELQNFHPAKKRLKFPTKEIFRSYTKKK